MTQIIVRVGPRISEPVIIPSGDVTQEANARIAADAVLQTNINNIITNLSVGQVQALITAITVNMTAPQITALVDVLIDRIREIINEE